jgi:hypothetical protein
VQCSVFECSGVEWSGTKKVVCVRGHTVGTNC